MSNNPLVTGTWYRGGDEGITFEYIDTRHKGDQIKILKTETIPTFNQAITHFIITIQTPENRVIKIHGDLTADKAKAITKNEVLELAKRGYMEAKQQGFK